MRPAGCSCALRSSPASHAPWTALSCAPTRVLLCTDASQCSRGRAPLHVPLPAKQARLGWPLHLLGPSMALAPGGACPDPSLHAATSVPPRVLSRATGHVRAGSRLHWEVFEGKGDLCVLSVSLQHFLRTLTSVGVVDLGRFHPRGGLAQQRSGSLVSSILAACNYPGLSSLAFLSIIF